MTTEPAATTEFSPIGPAMYFRYDVWLSDSEGNPLPQAGVLSAYALGKPPRQ